MAQTTVISVFKYEGLPSKWRAFVRMGFPPLRGKTIPGLLFWRPMGSGAGNGFSIKPDFSVYALVTVFENETYAHNFIQGDLMGEYLMNASRYSHVFMYNAQVHGVWNGQTPFVPEVPLNKKKPLCVITRATIKPVLVHSFWKNVPSVSKSMENFDGLVFSKGIGEWPLFMQATFSVWESMEHMMNYAYRNKKHAQMIKKTKETGWYREELFARFHPFDQFGDYIPSFL